MDGTLIEAWAAGAEKLSPQRRRRRVQIGIRSEAQIIKLSRTGRFIERIGASRERYFNEPVSGVLFSLQMIGMIARVFVFSAGT